MKVIHDTKGMMVNEFYKSLNENLVEKPMKKKASSKKSVRKIASKIESRSKLIHAATAVSLLSQEASDMEEQKEYRLAYEFDKIASAILASIETGDKGSFVKEAGLPTGMSPTMQAKNEVLNNPDPFMDEIRNIVKTRTLRNYDQVFRALNPMQVKEILRNNYSEVMPTESDRDPEISLNEVARFLVPELDLLIKNATGFKPQRRASVAFVSLVKTGMTDQINSLYSLIVE